jgi:type III restriction enzyme
VAVSLVTVDHAALMDQCLRVAAGAHVAYLMWPSVGDRAASAIYRACLEANDAETTLRPILDPYDPLGSTRHVGFNSTKSNFWKPQVERCQTNLIVCDGD